MAAVDAGFMKSGVTEKSGSATALTSITFFSARECLGSASGMRSCAPAESIPSRPITAQTAYFFSNTDVDFNIKQKKTPETRFVPEDREPGNRAKELQKRLFSL